MNSETSNTAVNARKVQIDRMNTAGTEALYGARPSPDTEGIYPYVYNMKVEVGMKVRSEKDGNVYIAIQPVTRCCMTPRMFPQSLVSYRRIKNLYNI